MSCNFIISFHNFALLTLAKNPTTSAILDSMIDNRRMRKASATLD